MPNEPTVVKNEPVLVKSTGATIVTIIGSALVAWNVPLTEEQRAVVLAALPVLGALAGGLWARASAVPWGRVVSYVTRHDAVESGPASGGAVGTGAPAVPVEPAADVDPQSIITVPKEDDPHA